MRDNQNKLISPTWLASYGLHPEKVQSVSPPVPSMHPRGWSCNGRLGPPRSGGSQQEYQYEQQVLANKIQQ